MTENKRFSLMEDGYYDCPPILDNGEELGYDDVLDMLNQLNDENELFKKMIQKYFDTTNGDGKQIISDLVDILEMKGMNVNWMDKRDYE